MTTVSPTPFAVSSFGTGGLPDYAYGAYQSRNNVLRPSLRRRSPLSVLDHAEGGFSADAPMMQRISIGDSSDDDIPIPMNFSALTKAILEDRPSVKTRSPVVEAYSIRSQGRSERGGSPEIQLNTTTPSRGALRIIRRSPPPYDGLGEGSVPRIVPVSGSRSVSGLRRSLSAANVRSAEKSKVLRAQDGLITPAPMPRARPAFHRTYSAVSNDAQSHYSGASGSGAAHSGEDVEDERGRHLTNGQDTSEQRGTNALQDSVTRGVTSGLADHISESVRIKRANVTRSVRGAPMRRPLRRRASDLENSPHEGDGSAVGPSPAVYAQDSTPSDTVERGSKINQEQVSVNDFAENHNARSIGQRHSPDSLHRPQPPQNHGPIGDSIPELKSAVAHQPYVVRPLEKVSSQPAKEQSSFKIPAPPPLLPYMNDQENEPPPTFKKNKPLGSGVLSQAIKPHVLSEIMPVKVLNDQSRPKSPPRPALSALSLNTPQRPAPPPPKMSVLETATATGGASTIKSKKKRTHVMINGKVFTHRGRLGKGGSSEVYRVMAENDKMFALKKVDLAKCSEDIVRGYKGEIELLKKLENVERVVKLYDWEVNEAKQSLSVLMEIGESDFNGLLNKQLNPENTAPENVKLDLSFTRYYWREMLCCVAAIHEHDIVHSDLKPSNFLLVQGRLKLIDFGIANAIDVDNTVNVHRETNIGTPNYMSPESLIDTNADQRGTGSSGQNAPKLMKLGKPCDVWTLGCILYQMTYGRPPFAHIKNQWHRIMAIINPNHIIDFPERGIGNAFVPTSLRDCLRSCLNRDASKRPTVAQLLDDRDRFLNPDREAEKWTRDGAVPITEHILEQILTRIVERCRDPKRGIPTDEEVKVYPKAFLDRVREMHKT